METWTVRNLEGANYVGVLEFEINDEWQSFEVVRTVNNELVFGGACNVGLLQSGYMPVDECLSLDENLVELLSDLESYYQYGPSTVSMIICNECM